jgi:EH domain-containing protein 3
MVLLLGQYSVGKTSFIRSLLKRDFPGQRVGPEPTTDRFMAVMYGNDERLVPGHALAMQVGGRVGG